ncbi:uracil-DNA glycosylase [Borrelia hermsii]|uniref:Uracil-DNA glycosylase n=3 Tax=Borrelia hermsii TaxID=140 RepID=UNG_BORHD|nr:uracil-DNA glycosylase [Borrelia hermsii]B2S1N8.1 RecName: Full=Uracil-DNA glycosylase; Short=UDG [Borrelia hermsii DAH]AAX16575.1 uracil-DNA glycosylase [Borrelia hermsii DAH]AMR75758.1 Uracil-DNA glycosylase [Borrelia hermsii]ANA42875.1 uracil-DNA glycosylase [Borrelia hermsii HS1]UPA07412.1 uracil-DNA glycosylase [Borrelia hermsii DAH]
MEVKIEESWKEILKAEFCKGYFKRLVNFIKNEYKTKKGKIFPPPKLIFNAFDSLPFKDIKVVILGQDPYHGKRQANGLAFSVNSDIKIPPSLQNIFKEIERSLKIQTIPNGDLTRWATQGVFLLNSILTVEESRPSSHKDIGWEIFTNEVIKIISKNLNNIVFMLWGNFARGKKELIDASRHLILETSHPSPYSAHNGFLGSNHFSQALRYLKEHNKSPIDFQ